MQAMAATLPRPHSLGWQNLSVLRPDRGQGASTTLCAGVLESHRPALMGYARRALHNAADAEDAVQDTLMAAIQAPDSFAGRSSLTSWLHGILKHKIMDIFRRRSRETALDEVPEREWLTDDDAPFAADGGGLESQARWGDPEVALARRDFLRVLESCMACLPERTARIFTLREIMELEVDEICAMFDMTANSCFVTLHRARLKLRTLLAERSFAPQPSACHERRPVPGRCARPPQRATGPAAVALA